MNNGQMLGQ